jgi:LCP family protein required for cell wall assembly
MAVAATAPSSGKARSQAPRRRRRAGRIVLAILLALVLALGFSMFGAWNWVNSQLNKTSWLSSMADDSAATSWLLLGSDERDGSAGGTSQDTPGFRTDTILVLTKPKSGASSLISIPRDSLMKVSDSYMKINAVAEVVGRKALVEQVESITGHKIDHVAEIRFGGLQKVVDAIGGVELCYDRTVDDADSQLKWTAGCHHADGATALAFSRMRYQDPNGDFGRAERQRKVIAAVVSKATSAKVLTNPSTVRALASSGLDSITVDEKSSPLTLVSMALAFKSATGDDGVTGSLYWSDPDYYVDGVGSSVLLDDAKNLDLFNSLVQGTHKAGVVGTLAESQ